MYSVWTKHLDSEDEKEKFRKVIHGSKRTLTRLGEILTEASSNVEMKELSPKIYETPNWHYNIAHINGFKECLKMVSNLINLDQKD